MLRFQTYNDILEALPKSSKTTYLIHHNATLYKAKLPEGAVFRWLINAVEN